MLSRLFRHYPTVIVVTDMSTGAELSRVEIQPLPFLTAVWFRGPLGLRRGCQVAPRGLREAGLMPRPNTVSWDRSGNGNGRGAPRIEVPPPDETA
jgi:hypothetical protein